MKKWEYKLSLFLWNLFRKTAKRLNCHEIEVTITTWKHDGKVISIPEGITAKISL